MLNTKTRKGQLLSVPIIIILTIILIGGTYFIAINTRAVTTSHVYNNGNDFCPFRPANNAIPANQSILNQIIDLATPDVISYPSLAQALNPAYYICFDFNTVYNALNVFIYIIELFIFLMVEFLYYGAIYLILGWLIQPIIILAGYIKNKSRINWLVLLKTLVTKK